MTTFLLIRHASHDLLGRVLVGREGDVPISVQGREEAQRLARHLADIPLTCLCSSPQRRAVETARLLERGALVSGTDARFDEIDFGEWAGSCFVELEPVPAWARWNCGRALARCPGGERMRDVQQRAVDGIKSLSASHPGGCVAVVSHGDVLKALLLHYLGMSLDLIHTLPISPASVSVLAIEGRRIQGAHGPAESRARAGGRGGASHQVRRQDCERAHLLLLNDTGSRLAAALGAARATTVPCVHCTADSPLHPDGAITRGQGAPASGSL